MLNRVVVIILLCALILMLFVVFLAARPIDDCYAAKSYLVQLGWQVADMPVLYEEVAVSGDSLPMLDYFRLQKEYGFELDKYDGVTVKRYTFLIENYPSERKVYANVLVYNGTVVGGDIMTRELDGFMKGLHKNGTS